ncbi:MAG: DUF4160 domain-containing protein [Oscillospiraceae bacterium]|nr:DUF4160 domain-containing protein [Oscillospiraceae bacterium]
MPLISHFFGILIHIYSEKNEQHHTPHFHAKYAGQRAAYSFDGTLLEGELPRKQHRLIQAWCEIRQDELNAAWEAWNESGEIVKIEGFK